MTDKVLKNERILNKMEQLNSNMGSKDFDKILTLIVKYFSFLRGINIHKNDVQL